MGSGRLACGGELPRADRSFKRVFLFLSVGLYALGWSLPSLSADDYLSELDAEVQKVEARSIDGESGEDAVVSPAKEGATVEAPAGSAAPGASATASRAKFERLLKEHYLGTFGFYKRLPERSREEVFEEYRRGADMGQLRREIIDRLLQR
jgi:hypothetical protein